MIVHESVHVVDGIVGLLVGLKHDKPVALALTGLLVFDHVHTEYAPAIGEQRVQIGLVGLSDPVHINDVTRAGAVGAATGSRARFDLHGRVGPAQIKQIAAIAQ